MIDVDWQNYITKDSSKHDADNNCGYSFKVNTSKCEKTINSIDRTSKLKIGTYNIRNLNEITKRQQLSKWAKDHKFDILLLQETNKKHLRR